MGNLNFADHAGFAWYCVLLMISGLTMVALGPLGRRSRFGIARNLVVGMAFLGYGLYLTFVFRGGHYVVFYWVLILPLVLITQTIRSHNGAKVRRRELAKQARYAEIQDAQEAHAAVLGRRSGDR
jgi:uncharacterized membrane protein